jgi:hypothetical protein
MRAIAAAALILANLAVAAAAGDAPILPDHNLTPGDTLQISSFSLVALLAVGLALSECTTGQTPLASSETPPVSAGVSIGQRDLTPEEKKVIMDAVALSLRNPGSAKYHWAKFPAVVTEGSVNYCATVDAQSPYAAYSGRQAYVVEAQISGNRVSSSQEKMARVTLLNCSRARRRACRWSSGDWRSSLARMAFLDDRRAPEILAVEPKTPAMSALNSAQLAFSRDPIVLFECTANFTHCLREQPPAYLDRVVHQISNDATEQNGVAHDNRAVPMDALLIKPLLPDCCRKEP